MFTNIVLLLPAIIDVIKLSLGMAGISLLLKDHLPELFIVLFLILLLIVIKKVNKNGSNKRRRF
jgi:hypothetical protein